MVSRRSYAKNDKERGLVSSQRQHDRSSSGNFEHFHSSARIRASRCRLRVRRRDEKSRSKRTSRFYGFGQRRAWFRHGWRIENYENGKSRRELFLAFENSRHRERKEIVAFNFNRVSKIERNVDKQQTTKRACFTSSAVIDTTQMIFRYIDKYR